MNMRFFFLLTFLSFVLANTEIINFQATEYPSVQANEEETLWHVLDASASEIQIERQPAPLYSAPDQICAGRAWYDCPYDAWFVFNLDDSAWERFSKFTFRISWPASSPTDFYVKTYTPPELLRLIAPTNSTGISNQSTRKLYARVRIVDTGVPTVPRVAPPVSFIAKLEPLYLGILPASLVPTVAVLICGALAVGFWAFPRVSRVIEGVAEDARKEISAKKK